MKTLTAFIVTALLASAPAVQASSGMCLFNLYTEQLRGRLLQAFEDLNLKSDTELTAALLLQVLEAAYEQPTKIADAVWLIREAEPLAQYRDLADRMAWVANSVRVTVRLAPAVLDAAYFRALLADARDQVGVGHLQAGIELLKAAILKLNALKHIPEFASLLKLFQLELRVEVVRRELELPDQYQGTKIRRVDQGVEAASEMIPLIGTEYTVAQVTTFLRLLGNAVFDRNLLKQDDVTQMRIIELVVAAEQKVGDWGGAASEYLLHQDILEKNPEYRLRFAEASEKAAQMRPEHSMPNLLHAMEAYYSIAGDLRTRYNTAILTRASSGLERVFSQLRSQYGADVDLELLDFRLSALAGDELIVRMSERTVALAWLMIEHLREEDYFTAALLQKSLINRIMRRATLILDAESNGLSEIERIAFVEDKVLPFAKQVWKIFPMDDFSDDLREIVGNVQN